jgi:hypothetical protein
MRFRFYCKRAVSQVVRVAKPNVSSVNIVAIVNRRSRRSLDYCGYRCVTWLAVMHVALMVHSHCADTGRHCPGVRLPRYWVTTDCHLCNSVVCVLNSYGAGVRPSACSLTSFCLVRTPESTHQSRAMGTHGALSRCSLEAEDPDCALCNALLPLGCRTACMQVHGRGAQADGS